MAYISTEEVKAIRTALKTEFPYVKFSVTKEHHSSVNIVVLEAPFAFRFDARNERYGEQTALNVHHSRVSQYYEDQDIGRDGQINQFGDKHVPLGDHECYVFLRKVVAIAEGQGWYDNSDLMTDYFNVAYYINISIGAWDKPFVRTPRPEGLAALEDAVVAKDQNDVETQQEAQGEASEEVPEGFLSLEALAASADRLAEILFTPEGELRGPQEVVDAAEASLASKVLEPSGTPENVHEFRSSVEPRDERLCWPQFLHKPSGTTPVAYQSLLVAYCVADVEEGLRRGFVAFTADEETLWAQARGYSIEDYPQRLASGQY